MAITITAAAEKFMQRMVRFGGLPNAGFRLTVAAGGCNGFASQFTLETAPQAGDATLLQNGLSVFLPAETCVLLEGGAIDCSDSSGLMFINPNAGNCGCANSGAGRGGRHAATVSIASIQRKARP
jgi:iron-sulfur cluster assembly protein